MRNYATINEDPQVFEQNKNFLEFRGGKMGWRRVLIDICWFALLDFRVFIFAVF